MMNYLVAHGKILLTNPQCELKVVHRVLRSILYTRRAKSMTVPVSATRSVEPRWTTNSSGPNQPTSG